MNHVLTHRKSLFDYTLLEGNDTRLLLLKKLTDPNHYGLRHIIKKCSTIMVLNHYILTKNISTGTQRHQKLIGMINDDRHF